MIAIALYLDIFVNFYVVEQVLLLLLSDLMFTLFLGSDLFDERIHRGETKFIASHVEQGYIFACLVLLLR